MNQRLIPIFYGGSWELNGGLANKHGAFHGIMSCYELLFFSKRGRTTQKEMDKLKT